MQRIHIKLRGYTWAPDRHVGSRQTRALTHRGVDVGELLGLGLRHVDVLDDVIELGELLARQVHRVLDLDQILARERLVRNEILRCHAQAYGLVGENGHPAERA